MEQDHVIVVEVKKAVNEEIISFIDKIHTRHTNGGYVS